MRQGELVVDRTYNRCHGVFIKQMSILDTFDDLEGAGNYILSHSTAAARRLGESSGGEHTVRWFGQLANGRTQVTEVSRFERGDLLDNSGAVLPAEITSLTVWHARVTDTGDDTISRAEPRQLYTGSDPKADPDAHVWALRRAAAGLHEVHPELHAINAVRAAVMRRAAGPLRRFFVLDRPRRVRAALRRAGVSFRRAPLGWPPAIDAAAGGGPRAELRLVFAGGRPAECRAALRRAADALRRRRFIFAGGRPAECRAALRRAAASLHRDHPASAKNGGVLGAPAGPPVKVLAVGPGDPPGDHLHLKTSAPAPFTDPPSDRLSLRTLVDPPVQVIAVEPDASDAPGDYLILKVVGHSRPVAEQAARAAAEDATATAAAIRANAELSALAAAEDAAGAAADVAAAAAQIADACGHTRTDAAEYVSDRLREARRRLRAADGRIVASRQHLQFNSMAENRMANVIERISRAARAVHRAAALMKEKSRWVVICVDSRMDHLCPICWARASQVIWDPGGDNVPVLPPAVVDGLELDAEAAARPADDGEPPTVPWVRTPAAGSYGEAKFRWLPARDWMREHRAPHLPAWDAMTFRQVLEPGILTPSPFIDKAHAEIRDGVHWDVLYSAVRADMMTARDAARKHGFDYQVTRDMIYERIKEIVRAGQAQTDGLPVRIRSPLGGFRA